MTDSLPIDWSGVVLTLAIHGRLMEVLTKLPRARWTERDGQRRTLLHYACHGDNPTAARALLLHGGLDVNVRDFSFTPAAAAAFYGQHRVLEVLCAAGADVRALTSGGRAPLDHALRDLPKAVECVRVLVANGVRLHTARADCSSHVTPDLEAFERGVLRCRAAVVALLRVGRTVQWGRCSRVPLALCVWATRYAQEWRPTSGSLMSCALQ